MIAATRMLRMAVTKTSTGLVGLPVDPNARLNLIALQQEILEKVKIIPATATYRQNVEAVSNYRLKVAQESTDEEAIEAEINRGQLEELINEGKDELKLIDSYAKGRLWEAVEELSEVPTK